MKLTVLPRTHSSSHARGREANYVNLPPSSHGESKTNVERQAAKSTGSVVQPNHSTRVTRCETRCGFSRFYPQMDTRQARSTPRKSCGSRFESGWPRSWPYSCRAARATTQARSRRAPSTSQGDGHQLGDGTPGSAQLSGLRIGHTASGHRPRVHPVHRSSGYFARFGDGPPCTQAEQHGCDELEGSVAIVAMPVERARTAVCGRKTPMPGTSCARAAIDFGSDGTFATCSEARTRNFEDESSDYNGPHAVVVGSRDLHHPASRWQRIAPRHAARNAAVYGHRARARQRLLDVQR